MRIPYIFLDYFLEFVDGGWSGVVDIIEDHVLEGFLESNLLTGDKDGGKSNFLYL